MSNSIGRRDLLKLAGVAAAAGAVATETRGEGNNAPQKIVGVCCSPRKGKTTAEALKLCLAAAQEHAPALQVELIELADMSIPAYLAAGLPLRPGETDDFPTVHAKLADPAVIGIIVGSPVYFGNMSALCKAFLDRCTSLRQDDFKLRNKVAGVVAVGSTRNGGQELTIQSIKTALLGQDVIAVGTGQSSVRIGATLWNQEDSIAQDAFGIGTAKDLGRHVAEIAVKLWPPGGE